MLSGDRLPTLLLGLVGDIQPDQYATDSQPLQHEKPTFLHIFPSFHTIGAEKYESSSDVALSYGNIRNFSGFEGVKIEENHPNLEPTGIFSKPL